MTSRTKPSLDELRAVAVVGPTIPIEWRAWIESRHATDRTDEAPLSACPHAVPVGPDIEPVDLDVVMGLLE